MHSLWLVDLSHAIRGFLNLGNSCQTFIHLSSNFFKSNHQLTQIICRRPSQLMFLDRYRAFHGFGQAKFPDGGSVLGSSQF